MVDTKNSGSKFTQDCSFLVEKPWFVKIFSWIRGLANLRNADLKMSMFCRISPAY